MSFYDPWTLGMVRVPTPPEPIWAFAARSAGNRAFAKAAREGADGNACMVAWQAAYDRVAATV